MRQYRGRTATTVLVSAAMLLFLLPISAEARDRTGSDYRNEAANCAAAVGSSAFVCSRARPAGRATGGHAYERWQNGSAALGSGTPPAYHAPLYYFRGYNALYGFGR